MQQPPARPGDPIDTIDTPALVLDLEAFDENVAAMAAEATRLGVALRPHAKSHKCAAIAQRQIEAGAVGICVQKIGEAAAFADAGIDDILVCNELVGAAKIEQLVALASRIRIAACVDDASNAAQIARAAREAGVVVSLLIEVDVGSGRCGVRPGAPVVALAQAICASSHLAFAGILAYQGGAQHIRQVHARREAAEAAIARARGAVEALAAAGIDCPIVTGAGTGTFAHEGASGVYTEIQPGSYVFMDADYSRNEWASLPFRQSLFVQTRVMSTSVPGQAIVDAGLKALAFDSGMPLVLETARPGAARLSARTSESLSYAKASDEHGTIRFGVEAAQPVHGHLLRLIPGHCDPTVNLYDWIVGIRADRVEAVWPIEARGRLA